MSHLRASSMIALRPSKPSASHAGCAARARSTRPATSSALMSGTWAMVSPVAGFSTGIVPAECPFCEVVCCGVSTVMRRVYAPWLSGQLDSLDHDVLDRAVPSTGLRALDLVDGVHPARDLPEHGVLAVEPRRRVGGDDEELAPVRVGPRVRHREGAALHLVVVELVLERVAGPARARALRAAALDHEVLDHAVEDQAVVEAVGGELAEVLDRLRRGLVEE